jgi:GNAT superfamily N-acetyltransferase
MDVDCLIAGEDSDVLVLMDGDEPVGLLGIFATNSFLGRQLMALEKYWYVMRSKRLAGYMLINAAQEWAKEHRCSHLIMSASRLASGMHDKVCKFYRSRGFKDFETSFIIEV